LHFSKATAHFNPIVLPKFSLIVSCRLRLYRLQNEFPNQFGDCLPVSQFGDSGEFLCTQSHRNLMLPPLILWQSGSSLFAFRWCCNAHGVFPFVLICRDTVVRTTASVR
jgi:hypothetical protein